LPFFQSGFALALFLLTALLSFLPSLPFLGLLGLSDLSQVFGPRKVNRALQFGHVSGFPASARGDRNPSPHFGHR